MSKPEDIKIWILAGIVATITIIVTLPVYYFAVVKDSAPVAVAEKPATFVTTENAKTAIKRSLTPGRAPTMT